MHPEVMDRARQEVLEVVGDSAAPTYEQIKNMRYRRPSTTPSRISQNTDCEYSPCGNQRSPPALPLRPAQRTRLLPSRRPPRPAD